MACHRDYLLHCLQRICSTTLSGLGLLDLIAALLIAILELVEQKLVEPLEVKKKLVGVENQGLMLGNNI